jgi:phospholipid-translocating ATPase
MTPQFQILDPLLSIFNLQDIEAKDVHVGDLVRIVSDADVPCDLVLLSSSDNDGRCYITTANLDGETNLKVW